MGFSTAAAFLIVFMAGMAAAVELLSAGEGFFYSLAEGIQEQVKRSQQQLGTSVEIVNVTTGAGGTVVYVENTGREPLNPDHLALILDGVWVEDNFSVTALGYFRVRYVNKTYLVKGAYHNSSAAVPLTLTTQDDTQVYNPSVTEPDQLYGIVGWFNITVAVSDFVSTNTSDSFYWLPGDVVRVATPLRFNSTVKVVVEGGVSDTYRAGEALPHAHVLSAESYVYRWD
ncbi:MAG: hypothetical protein GXO66_09630 [Euryarchaeota archaeon]|nr:hypothetical protein [Euryarchaeota archaeon]